MEVDGPEHRQLRRREPRPARLGPQIQGDAAGAIATPERQYDTTDFVVFAQQQAATDIARQLVIVYFGVIRPLVRTATTKAEREEVQSAPRAAAAESEEEGAIVQLGGVSPAAPFERKLAELRRIAQNDPKLLANLIKEWLGATEKR